MGKSVATVSILKTLSSRFELVIALVGTPSCQPALHTLMEQYWDPRFFFPTWDVALISRLMDQQEQLRNAGRDRHVAILVDDVVLTSEAAEQIAHLAMRGRHWLISLFMCGVSWSTLPKRVRRSLDVCMVFSCPMASDVKLLCSEYASNTRMAEFMMKQLEEHQCLVLETVTKVQRLYLWKADHWTPSNLQTLPSRSHEESENEASPSTPSGVPGTPRLKEISAPRDSSGSEEPSGISAAERSK